MLQMVKRAMVVLGLALVGFASARPASAEDFNGNVYLIVSLDDTFEFNAQNHSGSRTILVNIGTFVGGGSIIETRFINRQISTIPMPPGVTMASLNGNEATVLGTFQTTDESAQIHLMSPLPDEVPVDVQVAAHQASLVGALDGLLTVGGPQPDFPTTYDIASAIAEHLPSGSTYTVTDVANHLFGASVPMGSDGGTTFAEGDLFPHQPGSKLFSFKMGFDADGNFESDICFLVGVDVKVAHAKNNVSLSKDGILKNAFLSTATFDATEVDGSTGEIGGVLSVNSSISDVNGDGLDDLVIWFDVGDLSAAGVLTTSTKSLTMRADLADGSCVEGTDSVAVK
jgi:hypothetical protein